MSKLFFERRNENVYFYDKLRTLMFELCEIEAIEVLVSILRANYEIGYLKEKKPDRFKMAMTSDLEIIKKERYELVICLNCNKILMKLLGRMSCSYAQSDFDEQCEIIYCFLNQNYGDGNIDFRVFSPTYLEHMLGVDIPKIERVSISKERISSLKLYERNGVKTPTKVGISEHSLLKKIQQGFSDEACKSTNHIFENNAQRVDGVMEEIYKSMYIYPIVVYGEEDLVRDGTHRLACLYHLYGDIEVPVIRVYVDKPFYSYTLYRAKIDNIEMEVIK